MQYESFLPLRGGGNFLTPLASFFPPPATPSFLHPASLSFLASLLIAIFLNRKRQMIDTLWSSIKAMTVGNAALVKFYFAHLFTPYIYLPKELYNDVELAQRMGQKKDFVLPVDKRFVDEYNQDMNVMKSYIKQLWGTSAHVDYRFKQMLFWLVRFGTIAAAFHRTDDQLQGILLISLLQFIVLPYSLSVAFGYGLETVCVLYTGHAMITSILTVLASTIVPDEYNHSITISPTFLVVFFIIDQLLCTITLFLDSYWRGRKDASKTDMAIGDVWFPQLQNLLLDSVASGIWCKDSNHTLGCRLCV